MCRSVAVIEGGRELLLLAVAALFGAVCPTAAMANITPSAQELGAQLNHYNYIVGIVQTGIRQQNATATTCGRDLEIMLSAVASGEFWSLKVIDSYGAVPRSFAWGNYFWFASRDFCDDLNTPYRITFSRDVGDLNLTTVSPFPLLFRMVYLNFTTPHYVDLKLPFEHFIHLGVCLPASCSAPAVMNFADAYFRSEVFETQRNFALKLHAFDVRTPAFHWSLLTRTGTLIFITCSLLLAALVVLAELVHKPKIVPRSPQQPHTNDNRDVSSSHMTLKKLLLCFSLRENYDRAMRPNTRDQKGTNCVSAISGLRTIICLWVTVFHVYYYSLYAMANVNLIFSKLEGLVLQPVIQACFYVDVFFVISALLHVYHFLSRETDLEIIRRNNIAKNLKLYARTLLCRYMRLTPVLIVVMLASDIIFELLNTYSPFRLGVHSGIHCKNNWVYNLLYIQNLLDMRDICCSWTWYLACEMQYFVLSTALLFVYAKNAKAAKALYGAGAVAFAVTGWLCNYRAGITFQIDIVHTTLDALYVKPWVRINPYVAGAAFGWVLHRTRRTAGPRSLAPLALGWRTARVAFWILCAILYVATNFMSYWRGAPPVLVAAIMSVGKLIFASCVGAVIMLCANGHGGCLNALLSARPFAFLDKFCYSVYMAAPVIIFAVFGLRNEASHFTEVGSAIDFLAVVLLSIVAGILIVLFVELPMQRITDAFIRQRQSNGPHHLDKEPTPSQSQQNQLK